MNNLKKASQKKMEVTKCRECEKEYKVENSWAMTKYMFCSSSCELKDFER